MQEDRKLGYFVGKWAHEGEIKASSFGPAGKFTYTERCDWFAGRHALVCRSKGKVPEGRMTGLSLISWNAAEKAYAYFEINSTGEVIYSRGTARGATWTWKNAGKRLLNGKPVRTRMTVKQVSRNLATYKLELSASGRPMILVMQGRQKRVV